MGGEVITVAGTIPAGEAFPPDRLQKHINQKEMYSLYHLLRQFCTRHPDVLRRAQVPMDVNNQSVVGALTAGMLGTARLTHCWSSCSSPR